MTHHSWRDAHIRRAARSLAKIVVFAVALFAVLLVVFHIVSTAYVSSLSRTSAHAFDQGIRSDLGYAKDAGDTLASDHIVVHSVEHNDADTLLPYIKEQSVRYGTPSISVTDRDGVAISRTKKLGIQSDNLFLTLPEGRIVAQGGSVQSIGQGVINPDQIRMVTGRPVVNDGVMIGGLFTGYSMDDAYALRFRDAYLPHGVQVAFYTTANGIFGDSIQDTDTRNVIASYFDPGSAWIHDGLTGKTISFDGRHFYVVKNIPLAGLEGTPGGALVFIPRRDISDIANFFIACAIACLCIIRALRQHRRSRGEETGWRYYVLVAAFIIPVIALVVLSLRAEKMGYLRLSHVPYEIYNSTLRFQPEFGVYDTDVEQQLTIIADTGDEAINAIQVGLVFDPASVTVVGIEPNDGVCTQVIENTVDQKNGTAAFSCVVLKPEGERGSLAVADVVVMPTKPGTFTLAFDPKETAVLASDGLGTNVLRMSQSGSYQAIAFDPTTAHDSVRSVAVFSPTHPNQSRWYNASSATIVWHGAPDASYRYVFDMVPDTIPTTGIVTANTAITLPIPADGTFYFHIQPAIGGPVAHYRIQADRTPPSVATIRASEDSVTVGDVVRFIFEGKDEGSGMQQNYYVDLGNGLFLPTHARLFMPFLEAGEQTIILRVYDAAGNYAEQTQTIHVQEAQ